VVLFGYGSRGRIFVSHSGPIGWLNLYRWLPKLPVAEGTAAGSFPQTSKAPRPGSQLV
jgi:hypothetical protein